jgi:hypothetical protein
MAMTMMNMTMMNVTSTGLMPSSMMAMIFYNSHSTPLYSLQFAPTSNGGYAGACIFLIILSTTFRGLFAIKHLLETRWANQAWNRRYVVVADKTPMAERLERDPDAKHAVSVRMGSRNMCVWWSRRIAGCSRGGLVWICRGRRWLLLWLVLDICCEYFPSLGSLLFGLTELG